ncbi:hypothetical protein [Pseudoxanthomonas sacheonensis]|uniref:NTF2 fold immunity protein n=1 Tax=Pseudoxanthomonas sacheonensis TaxID=443615 RepID=A0ABU1RU64_9GAMM|nr:hypothetical protein [Pseudoxanthomonas sacheonensis]MDR6841669.1 hypothetical protein [Pseudoxanthomonas sacheonensis]
MRKWLNLLAVLLLALMVAAPASALGKRKKGGQLEAMQLAYATAIRWGEFEEAWQLVDPAYREAHPMTELAFERYKHIEISGYTDKNSSVSEDGNVLRNVELRVINKHNMAERSLRYREEWRWDPVAKRWWLVVGLPDLWNGE